jgi:hypothetical protein
VLYFLQSPNESLYTEGADMLNVVRKISREVRQFVFNYYILIFFIAVVLTIVVFFNFSNEYREDLPIVITIIGGVFSLFYFVQQQQIEELKLFKELFNDFNGRYDKLNNRLNEIRDNPNNNILTREDKATLDDYFNLCSEEYFYYIKGYIEPDVWQSWCRGMLYFLGNDKIRTIWLREEKTGSYYGLTLKEIERGARAKK